MLNSPVEVAPDVFLGRGTYVNWVLLRDGTDLTLIDSGYPGDVAAVEASIRALGRAPEDVRALLITHAHVDHIGAANHLHERYGIPAYTGTQEVRHAHREYLEQAGPADVIRNAWRPGVLPWALRISRKGAASRTAVAHAQPFPAEGPLDLPGHPVPVLTAGHTSGHTVYHLPAVGAVVTGDALVTGHPTSRRHGPQLLPAMFNHGNPLDALPTLAALDADLILPGHGDPHRQALNTAADEARARA
jgi:glyoxylase-like metal-dependent hydrolase (beta-lactamase superfamily II)